MSFAHGLDIAGLATAGFEQGWFGYALTAQNKVR
jgi:hypothetical protein